MKRLLVGVVCALSGCEQQGTPELILTATPNAIRASGEVTTIRAVASDGKLIGKGTVRFTANAGTLLEPVDVELDAYGTAKTDISCDQMLDPNCNASAMPSFKVEARWEAARGEVLVTLKQPPPTSETLCGNGADDDEDGQIDCADTDCDNTTCDDRLPCTINERCTLGVCTGGAPRTCTMPTNTFCAAGAGTCDPAIGCVYPAQNVGVSCDDGDRCTMNDRCTATGRCAGEARTCPAQLCKRDNPTCDRTTGQCVYTNARDGTQCGTRLSDVCCDGSCVAISNDTRHCGTCGVQCEGSFACDDAVNPGGCGPSSGVSGRCVCTASTDCPSGYDCVQFRCSPRISRCDALQTRVEVSSTCPAYCRY